MPKLSASRSTWRKILIGLLVLAAGMAWPHAAAHAEESRETIRLAVGASTSIALTETPSTGYRWRLNSTASSNLAIVAVSDAGYASGASGKPLVGAPGQHRFRIAARRGGTATAVFDYVRSWEHVAPARRHVVTIESSGR